jgi:hypothetical protein
MASRIEHYPALKSRIEQHLGETKAAGRAHPDMYRTARRQHVYGQRRGCQTCRDGSGDERHVRR